MSKFVSILRIMLVFSLLISTIPNGAFAASGNSGEQPGVAPSPDRLLNAPDPAQYLPPVAQLPELLTRSSTYSPASFLSGQGSFGADLLGKPQDRSNPLDPASGSLALLQQIGEVNQYLVDAFAFDEAPPTTVTTDITHEPGTNAPADGPAFSLGLSIQPSQVPQAISSSTVAAASTTISFAPESQPASAVNRQPVAAPSYVLPDDKVIRSVDDRIQVVLPGAAIEGVGDVSIATIPVKSLHSLGELPQGTLSAFTLSSTSSPLAAARSTKANAARWLRQPVALSLSYDDEGLTSTQEQALRLYAYNADLGQWYTLPSQVDPATNTMHTQSLALTTYALAPAILGATQDPCAIAVPMIPDTDRNGESDAYPFRNAPTRTNGSVISQDNFHPRSQHEFPNFSGTLVILSGTDTGNPLSADPTVTNNPIHTKDIVRVWFPPEGEDTESAGTASPFEKTKVNSIPAPDISTYIPENPIDIPLLDGGNAQRRVFVRTAEIGLWHEDSTQWGSSGYYLVRKDIADPIITQFYTYHDGEGGVNLYVTAYDNCAVKQIGATTSNSTGVGMSTMFEYLGVSPDGLGLYRAAVQLAEVGKNTYTVLVEDMADYDGPNTVTATYSESASSSAGDGMSEMCGKSPACADPGCGCTAILGMAADPVNTASGNFTLSRTDAAIAGIGDTDIVVDRSYNSLASGRYYSFIGTPRKQVPPFGIGWTSPFGFDVEVVESLPLVGPGVKVNYPDGHSTRYSGVAGLLTPLTPGEVNILQGAGTSFVLTDKATLSKYRFTLAVDPTKPVNIASLVEKTDANGNTITYTPGPFGPTAIANSAGRTVNLTYNGDGLITQIGGPEGLSLSYTYSNLLLTSMTDERGQTTTYSYDGEYRLVQEATPKGHPALRLTYAADGRVQSQIVGAGESYAIAYDDGAFKRTLTDALGNTEVQQYDANYRLLSVTDGEGYAESYTYTAQDYRASFTNKKGNTWAYTYDARGNLTRTDGPMGWSHAYTYNGLDRPTSYTDALGRTTNFTYDGAGNLTGITNAAGDSMSIAYDRGLPATVADFLGHTVTNTYDGAGDLVQTVNAEGDTFAMTYDGLGRMTNLTTPSSTSGPAAFTYAYDQASDLLTSVSGPLGLSLAYTYDANRNLVSERDGNGNPSSHEYDNSENRIKTTDSLGGTINYSYDAMNNMTSTTDQEGRTTSYKYDKVYNQIEVQAPAGRTTQYKFDGVSNRVQMTDPQGQVTDYTYDALNRMTQETADAGGLNASTAYVYDLVDNVLSITDPNGHTTAFVYDPLNRLTQETNPEGEATQYAYDKNGNLTGMTDGNGNPTGMTYDNADRLKTVTNAEGETISFTYDGLGNPVDFTAANGVITRLAYDQLFRVKSVTSNPGGGGGSDADVVFAFTYDLNNNMTNVVDAQGKPTAYEYDALNRLIKETDALTKTVVYAYDKVGNLLKVTDKRGNATDLAYDDADRLIKITDARSGVTAFTYDKADNLLTVVDANAHTTTLTYDGLYRLVTAATPQGNTTRFAYDLVANMTQVTDARNSVTKLDYDKADRVVKVTDAENGTTQVVYDDAGNILRLTDANGHTTQFSYDKVYRLTLVTDPLGLQTVLTYDVNGNVTKVIDTNGNPTTYEYDKLDRVVKVTNAEDEPTDITYDKVDNVISVKNPREVVTQFAYDDLHRLITAIEGFVSGGPNNSDTNVTYRYEYDPNDNLTKIIDPEGNQTIYGYDVLDRLTSDTNALGHAETYAYDAVGNLTQMINRRGYPTDITYDKDDRLITVTDALNGVTRFAYDATDNLINVTDANGHASGYTYDKLNRLTRATNPESHAVNLAYDAVGNLTQVQDAKGNQTKLAYDANDRLTDITDALSGVTSLTYDGLDNVVLVNDANGHTTQAAYDKAYRLTSITDAASYVTAFTYDKVGNMVKVRDGNGHDTALDYDKLDRMTRLLNAAGEQTRYTYDRVGSLVDTIENDNITTRNGYDAIYQLTSVTMNFVDGGPVDHQTNVRYNYAYDENGNLTGITDPRTFTTRFDYDKLDRLSKETNPIGNVWDYTYDPVGNLSTRVDGSRLTTQYTYYPDDQLQHIDYTDGSAVNFAYDANNNMETMADSLGTSKFDYDALDRVTAVKDSLGRNLGFGYDAVGNRTRMTYPNGGVVSYAYYDNDWLHTMTDTAGGVTRYTRDGVGQMTRTDHANATTVTATYDDANRLLTLANRRAEGDLISSFEYTLNNIGQRSSAHMVYDRPWPKDVTETYAYDPLRRLTGVTDTDGFAATYAYDAAGNRTLWTVNDDQMTDTQDDAFEKSYTYNGANQLLTEATDYLGAAQDAWDGLTTYAYDGNGNRINKEWQGTTTAWSYAFGTDYAYDGENRLVQAVDYRVNSSLAAGNRLDYQETRLAYDGLGRRLSKSHEEQAGDGRTATTEYVFDGLDIVADYPIWQQGESLGRNNHYSEYYRGDLGEITLQRRFPNGVPAQITTYHYDGRHNVTSLTAPDDRGLIHYRYDAYGQQLPEWGNTLHPYDGTQNRFGLTGKEWDQDTEAAYFGARYYNPDEGLWLTPDSYRGVTDSPQTLHRYSYVNSSPIDFTDAYGFEACKHGEWGAGSCKTWAEANIYCENCIFGYESSAYNASESFTESKGGRVLLGLGETVVDTGVGLVDMGKAVGKSTIIYAAIDEDEFMNQWERNIETWDGLKQWGSRYAEDPWDALSEDYCAISEQLIASWKEDPYKFSGNVLGEVILTLTPVGVAKVGRGGAATRLLAGPTDELFRGAGKVEDTEDLLTTLNKIAKQVDEVDNTVGPVTGTKKHAAFTAYVDELDLSNVQTEITYMLDRKDKLVPKPYGTKGAIRLDVVEYDEMRNIVKVYDLKTGSAKLTNKRIQQIKDVVGENVEVIEVKP